ncbi:MAG: alanine racemase, partial [Ktedonobacterales bacterium]
ALRDFTPLPGRMRLLEGRTGLHLLDDSHNATPTSAAAGLVALTARARHSHAQRIAVLGDMLRLGAAEHTAHEELGRLVATHADYLVTQGERAELLADTARQQGLAADHIAVTHTAEDAAQAALSFAAQAQEGTGAPVVVYIKGSEELRMERVTALLLAHPEQAEALLDRQTAAWRRVVVMRPDRPTWLEIDLSAIGHNTRLVKDLIGPEVRLLISLKADAYGHGALRVARTTLNNGAEWLGVATVSEAQPLRAAGITAPMLIFGYMPAWQARDVVRLDLRATVYSIETAQALSRAAGEVGGVARVHVKVDTGMARLGLRADTPEDVAAILRFVAAVQALPHLCVEGIFTHFATADSADQTYARRQIARFHTVLDALDAAGLRPGIVHASNSAATFALPEARFDLVRAGIAIYGLNPSDEVRLPDGFRPALTFKTQVAQVKELPAGEGVSYGATFITPAPMRIATLPVGYADGFRRAPGNWGEVLVRGQRAPLLGRVAMDQCMVDVTQIPGVAQGDEVVLIGRQGNDAITADEVARRLGTISYEVVAELLARVPRLS